MTHVSHGWSLCASCTWPLCYFTHPKGQAPQAIELINNQWHGLIVVQGQLATRQSLTLADPASLRLGWWSTNNPTHPEYQQPHMLLCSTFWFTQTSDSLSGSSPASAHTAQGETEPYQPININIPLSPIILCKKEKLIKVSWLSLTKVLFFWLQNWLQSQVKVNKGQE